VPKGRKARLALTSAILKKLQEGGGGAEDPFSKVRAFDYLKGWLRHQGLPFSIVRKGGVRGVGRGKKITLG